MACVHGLQHCGICNQQTAYSQGKISTSAFVNNSDSCIVIATTFQLTQELYLSGEMTFPVGSMPAPAPFQPQSQQSATPIYLPNQYHYSPPLIGTSGYGYYSADGLQQSPPLASTYQMHSFHGHRLSDPVADVPGYGYHPATPPTNRSRSSNGNRGGAGSPPKLMKHMTCYFWHHNQSCIFSEEECLYAHKEFVPERVAGPPMRKEAGSKPLSRSQL